MSGVTNGTGGVDANANRPGQPLTPAFDLQQQNNQQANAAQAQQAQEAQEAQQNQGLQNQAASENDKSSRKEHAPAGGSSDSSKLNYESQEYRLLMEALSELISFMQIPAFAATGMAAYATSYALGAGVGVAALYFVYQAEYNRLEAEFQASPEAQGMSEEERARRLAELQEQAKHYAIDTVGQQVHNTSIMAASVTGQVAVTVMGAGIVGEMQDHMADRRRQMGIPQNTEEAKAEFESSVSYVMEKFRAKISSSSNEALSTAQQNQAGQRPSPRPGHS